MKNLDMQTAATPKRSAGKSANRKFLYSICAALFLLTCSLSTKAQDNSGLDSTFAHVYTMPYTLGFGTGQYTSCYTPVHTTDYPLVNNYGSSYTSGKDKWIKITLASVGTLKITGGTADYDSVFYLFDSNGNLIASGDDGTGSNSLQPTITKNLYNGTYYLVVDGSTKSGSSWPASGGVSVQYNLTH